MGSSVPRRSVLVALFGLGAGCLDASDPGEEPDDPDGDRAIEARGAPIHVEIMHSNPDVTYRAADDTVEIASGQTDEPFSFEEWAVPRAGLEAASRLRRDLETRLTDEETVGLSTGLGGSAKDASGFRLVVSLETKKDERGAVASTPNAVPEDIAGDVPERVDVDFEFEGRSLQYSYDVVVESVTESLD